MTAEYVVMWVKAQGYVSTRLQYAVLPAESSVHEHATKAGLEIICIEVSGRWLAYDKARSDFPEHVIEIISEYVAEVIK